VNKVCKLRQEYKFSRDSCLCRRAKERDPSLGHSRNHQIEDRAVEIRPSLPRAQGAIGLREAVAAFLATISLALAAWNREMTKKAFFYDGLAGFALGTIHGSSLSKKSTMAGNWPWGEVTPDVRHSGVEQF
jgi:hypothetical protein